MDITYGNTISVMDYNSLRSSAGWEVLPEKKAQVGILNSAYLVSANINNKTIGMARVIMERKGVEGMIISASRRTDIPAFYSEWFMNRLREGYVLTRNPMNHSQISRINLTPDVIDCIVFWTKDPYSFMDKLPVLDSMGYKYYFQFTLTPYGREMEQNLRDKKDIIRTFISLSEAIGKKKVLWRYDPVILNTYYTFGYHKEMFESLCSQLQDYTEICTISFVDLYSKLKKQIKNVDSKSDSPDADGFKIRGIPEDEMRKLAANFSEIGKKYGITLRACSEKVDLSEYGIYPASCIDKGTVEKVCGYPIAVKHDTNQRPGCGCIQSIDIGAYNTCRNGCRYCYANHGDTSIIKNFDNHCPNSELLVGAVKDSETIKTRDIRLLRNDQQKLF